MGSVLIIDDEEKLRSLLAKMISLEGFRVAEASSGKQGLKHLEREPAEVVICDVKLPDGSGVDFTKKIKELSPHTEVIVFTAFGTINDGVRAIKNGAFDYLIKGDDNEKILPLLHKAMDKSRLLERVSRLEQSLQQKFGFARILGQTPNILQAISEAKKVATTDTTVLLLGETGTGKEIFARAIHAESHRRTKPFIALNCSAISKDLLESELFGHAAGAFTGAVKEKKGLLEEAQDGIFFLDEIGDLGLELQAKLLRVLENREFYRVGEVISRKTSVRFIAATNRNLLQEIEAGHFRNDLYFRLSVFQIQLPSLNERKSDTPMLAEYFITEAARKINKPVPVVKNDFLKSLQHHFWKGNIRELKNVIERAVILCEKELNSTHLPSDFDTPTSDSQDLANMEKAHIQRILKQTQGNKTAAAKILGIGLTTLYQKIKDFGLPHGDLFHS